MKAYYVEESVKGTALFLVYASNAREAREIFGEQGEAIDTRIYPNGVHSVRRAPEEDR